ncbi:putative Ig domain-containing protein [Chloroflexota bacterium]
MNSICDGTIEVMPLGDSITTGKYSGHDTDVSVPEDDIGYRKDLWDLLTGSGYTVNFVGSVENGAAYPFSDPQHEGHNGWRDDEIAENIFNNGGANWLNANPPDVILLHIGTNSLNSGASEVADILDEINEFEVNTGSSVIVIVARIIDMVPNNPVVHEFNNNVEDMVTARPDYNSEVFMVDMEDGGGLNYSIYHDVNNPLGDFIDDLHPYATGYTKMANVWKAKFDEIYASCGTNSPPDVDPVVPDPQVNDEGESNIELPIVALDPDDDPLTYSAVNLPGGLSINPSSGLISGTISNTAAESSPYQVQVTVSDGKPLGSTTIGFYWTINYINLNPTLQNPGNQSHAEGDPVSLDLNASDLDNDSLTFSAVNLPQGLTINQNTDQMTGTIGYQASNGSPHLVEITVADDGSPILKDTVIFTWTVANQNGPPLVTPVGDQNDLEGTILDPPLQIAASDPDGDSLQFQATNLPPGLSINENYGQISGMIDYDASPGSPYAVVITVTDDGVPTKSTQTSFSWAVGNVNGKPEVTNPGTLLNHPGDIVNKQIEASDPDGDGISFLAHGLPPKLKINAISGLITGELPEWALNSSPYTVEITATDDGEPSHYTIISFIWIVQEPGLYLPLLYK